VVKDITEWDEYTGRFEAVNYVEVRARVSGYLESIHFYDGQLVEEGDLLFVVDKRPFEAALAQAKGRAAEAAAQSELARNDRQRAEKLLKAKAVSQEEYDQRLQTERASAASLAAAEAAVKAAALDLEFAEVRAPISGRVSDRRVTVGNLVSGGQGGTVLTTIASLDPIHFVFDASEKAYLRYTRLSEAGERPSSRDKANPVFARLTDETDFSHEGFMNFVDNEVDPATGTMRGRAIFENADGLLTPGMFGRLRLAGSEPYRAILLPEAAIQSDQTHKFVWIVNKENKVEYRPLTLGPLHDEGLRIVRQGLAPGDLVIVDGVQRAQPGAVVTPERAAPQPKPAEVAASN
jgi:RND family efflux transporter MFP subunit